MFRKTFFPIFKWLTTQWETVLFPRGLDVTFCRSTFLSLSLAPPHASSLTRHRPLPNDLPIRCTEEWTRAVLGGLERESGTTAPGVSFTIASSLISSPLSQWTHTASTPLTLMTTAQAQWFPSWGQLVTQPSHGRITCTIHFERWPHWTVWSVLHPRGLFRSLFSMATGLI